MQVIDVRLDSVVYASNFSMYCVRAYGTIVRLYGESFSSRQGSAPKFLRERLQSVLVIEFDTAMSMSIPLMLIEP